MLYAILGYIVAVVFPIPWLNSSIINLWKNLGYQIELWFKGGPDPDADTTTAPSAPVSPTPPVSTTPANIPVKTL